jgi:hypothetical protein
MTATLHGLAKWDVLDEAETAALMGKKWAILASTVPRVDVALPRAV